MAKNIWIITDNIPGNANQSIALADAISLPYKTQKINFNIFGRLPNILKGSSLFGVTNESKNAITDIISNSPNIIISCGRRLAPIARYIKKKSKDCKIIHILWPETGIKDFDLIIVPEHDNVKICKNIVTMIGAIQKTISIDNKEDFYKKWEKIFHDLPKPWIGLIIGGSTKKNIFTKDHAKKLARLSNTIAKDLCGSLLITSSRRTSDDAVKSILDNIEVPHFFYNWKSDIDNPYTAYLLMSDILFVTGDSISMCIDCCSSGKPVYIYNIEDITPKKHQIFHKNLFSMGIARILNKYVKEIEYYSYKPLAEAQRIAKIVKEKIIC